ncbi:hypothetical protein FHS83_001095 [Rhizomicrobium palustre]|uniref:LytTR family transcriptional regulator n=1 Tax=Rhizomicrobium palustre TaxID=189966 RepID=A0A846MXS3_9PROT|nr:DUF4159 domain-containing protein [Rhizomicrobium palustre]NIK87777.1 hypothetical protein [Rhizomicrobium palustre]
MGLIPSISFGAPWILLGLIALPAIWFLLRVTPPLPKRVVFPPLRLLLGLRDEEQTPAGTPWWLMVLRILAAAGIIVALAEPQIGRTLELPGTGPLVLFVDNGWTAAPAWQARMGLLREAVDQAARANRPVAIVSSAEKPQTDFLDAGKADQAIRALQPKPWRTDRAAAAQALAKLHPGAEVLWLSDSVEDGNARTLADALSRLGHITLFSDRNGGALAIASTTNTAAGFEITVIRAGADSARDGLVSAIGEQGQTLGTSQFHFGDGQSKIAVKIAIPLEMRNQTARIEISGQNSAGAVTLMDRGTPRRAVGLVSGSPGDEPLLSGSYYLERALAPYADVHKGTIADLLARNVSVLILVDVGKIAGADHDRVTKFVENGGLLVRFAGEHTAGGTDDLVPVSLRGGGRYLGSALAWASPQRLASFPEASPFSGLTIPQDVTVSRQILAEPTVDLAAHSWARLADGTPMVTAAQRGKGWIVQFHVTAGPDWSNLPMSGLYVDMLRRLLTLSSGVEPAEMAANAMLPPSQILDGFGKLVPANSEAQPIRSGDISTTEASAQHPPGLYGSVGAERALNAAHADTVLLPLPDLSLSTQYYANRAAVALQTPLLVATALLLFVDFVISLILRGYVPNLRRLVAGSAVFLIVLHLPSAKADDAQAMKAALDTRLAYVTTGLADLDGLSKAGLTGLGKALSARTSYTPEEPLGVNLERDDLSFFPLIYWPMDPHEKDLSPAALSKIAEYMRNGGTLLIDTRDLTLGPVRGPNNPGQLTLRRLLGKLDLPPLAPVPQSHVLTKTFYLISSFPGRWDGGTLWAQTLPTGEASLRAGDGVSPIIIGGNDFAAAWAVDGSGRPLMDVTPGGATQREMSIRFGINLVMYALTGNYKTDLVHVPAILQRLGKSK